MVVGDLFRPNRVRSAVLFLVGLAAFIYELVSGGERTTILILSAAMMGLPAFLQVDERRARENAEKASAENGKS